ncbi:MAG TPA: DinB family protein [Gemmatimonadaceae bacterium]|jgi:uncharacterized damage-inducible protein DinB|nr:DinB family protein [Gemmatimonadaceae bacterium]
MPTTAAPIIPLKEFDREMETTRHLIERVPNDKAQWKPHPKSFALGHLAQLVCWIPGWIADTLRQPFMDITGGGKSGGYSIQQTDALLEMLDNNVRDAHAAVEQVTGAALDEPWSLKMGDTVVFTEIRGEAVRTHLSHLIHHRGQLSVYLRLVDVPLPQIYGPTADDRGFLKS